MSGASSSSSGGGSVQVALVTGASRRIGAGIATHLHRRGLNLALHCHRGVEDARELAGVLNRERDDSAVVVTAELGNLDQLQTMADAVIHRFGRLDVLVNNASTFWPSPLGQVDEGAWNALMDSNLKGPFFLSQALLPQLAEARGAIVNIGDVHGRTPLSGHTVYCAAKAGLLMATRAMAKDLAPRVRVNAVSPGSILWPLPEPAEAVKRSILERIPMGRRGEVEDIAGAVAYLALDAPYVTGQVLEVDGGRSLNM